MYVKNAIPLPAVMVEPDVSDATTVVALVVQSSLAISGFEDTSRMVPAVVATNADA